MRSVFVAFLFLSLPLAAGAGDQGLPDTAAPARSGAPETPAPVPKSALLRGDAPAWVDAGPIPAPTPEQLAAARDGVYYALTEAGMGWEGETRVSDYRVVTLITDRAGLEQAASIGQNFDPAYETLTLTRLSVIRDGKTISYRDTLPAEIFRREERLEGGIIDGTLTVHLQIPDLRVGDMIDKAFTTRRRPLFEGASRAGRVTMEFGVPVGLSRTVAMWPAGWPMTEVSQGSDLSHTQEPQGDVVRHEWRREGHIPPPFEEMVPSDFAAEASVEISAWSDWAPLSAALAPHYTADYPLTPEWDLRVREIASAHPDPLGRATAALRMVQDEIRYVGIEVGEGGYFARSPQTVTEQGFGDCKDKSLLLTVMLARLGVEAHPALTALYDGYGLAARAPAVSAFDHMIVKVVIGGHAYWVDPTGSYEGGRIDRVAPPGYGYALPLTGPDQHALEPIETRGPVWTSETVERYDFSAGGVALTVDTTFGGAYADSRRYDLATEPRSDIARRFLGFYNDRYPGIRQVKDLLAEDSREENSLRLEEHYALSESALLADGLRDSFAFATEDFGNNYPDPQLEPRRAPLLVGPRRRYQHTVDIRNAPIDFIAPDPVTIENDAFRFTLRGTVPAAKALRLVWVYETKARTIPPGAVAGIIADARRMSDETWYTWNLDPNEVKD